MQPASNNLFVYGSLRSGFNHPAYAYISKYFKLIAPAKVQAKLYDLGDFPAATPTDENFFVIGELYTLARSEEYNWAFGQLDDYEGVCVEEGELALYRRDLAEIILPDNSSTTAWVYWYNQPLEGYPLVPSGDVLAYLKSKQ